MGYLGLKILKKVRALFTAVTSQETTVGRSLRGSRPPRSRPGTNWAADSAWELALAPLSLSLSSVNKYWLLKLCMTKDDPNIFQDTPQIAPRRPFKWAKAIKQTYNTLPKSIKKRLLSGVFFVFILGVCDVLFCFSKRGGLVGGLHDRRKLNKFDVLCKFAGPVARGRVRSMVKKYRPSPPDIPPSAGNLS